ncbi:unnamed protein product [Brassica oleracea var. botrytis]|nr:unnamed protein product [Brassica oleracea]
MLLCHLILESNIKRLGLTLPCHRPFILKKIILIDIFHFSITEIDTLHLSDTFLLFNDFINPQPNQTNSKLNETNHNTCLKSKVKVKPLIFSRIQILISLTHCGSDNLTSQTKHPCHSRFSQAMLLFLGSNFFLRGCSAGMASPRCPFASPWSSSSSIAGETAMVSELKIFVDGRQCSFSSAENRVKCGLIKRERGKLSPSDL